MLVQEKCDFKPDLIMAMEDFYSIIEDFIQFPKETRCMQSYYLFLLSFSLYLSHSVFSSSQNQANNSLHTAKL